MSRFDRLFYGDLFRNKSQLEKTACTLRCRIQIDTKNQIRQIANNGPDMSTRHKLMHYYF